ncbi:glutamate ABC transporter substrate-binding protein [Actinoplanes palleronii]|uniref:Amino acid-binding protein n=1 Tax=Actinoplanes palleronii TaxID=113570 RepID=A0ABQ4BNK6_9ACTN|nr:glutamate ABC transporter substrate-binding protein [Actinoplanes palleronii]GIE72262.1 amino acid-binding protein [Actinoplanes palleronii]
MGRLRTSAAVVAAAVLLAAGGCGGDSGSLPGNGASGGNDVDAIDQILADAPVAPDSAIPAGTLMASIKQRGTMNVGGTDAGPVFSIRDPVTGKLTGFDADLSMMLAKYIIGKPSTKLSITTVDTREAMLQNGTVDAVFATYTITPGRAEKVDFAGPYYSSGDAIMVQKDNTTITEVGDLNGKNVATEGNSTAAEAIKKFAPGATVTLFQDDASCVAAVRQGRVDAYVLDQGILLGDATKVPDVKVVGQPFTTEPYGIGVPKQNPEMKAFVNTWLQQIESSGLWNRLYAATVGKVVTGTSPKPPAIGGVPGT